jgi:hypothetical protein
MAITRTQIAKQLLEQGGRVGLRFGSEGYQGGRTDQGGAGPGSGSQRGEGRDPMAQFGRTPEERIAVKEAAQRDLARTKGLGDVIGLNRTPFLSTQLLGKLLNKKQITENEIRRNQMIRNLGLEDEDDNMSGGADQQIILPPMLDQAPSITEQEPEEEVDMDDRSLSFRANGGRAGLAEGGMPYEGGIMDLESARQMYGLGKLVKKVTRTVKKIAKSPIGKAALLYTGAGALGNLAGGSGLTGAFRGFTSPTSFLGGAKNIFNREGLRNIFVGRPGSREFLQKDFRGKPLYKTISESSGLFGTGGEFNPLTAISAASALAGLLTPEQEQEAQQISDNTGIDIEAARNQILAARQDDFRARAFRAEGGSMDEPVAKKTMPLLDMDGKEMDLRAEGGFVPIGRMEKADDVPARLSKNEFVFTADAVRNAGDGSVDKGAEVMYNMMKNLESGGDVSEESQGLEGARKMFQTSQRLEEVL